MMNLNEINMDKPFFRTKEYACIKGVHEKTVQIWCRTGYVKAERVGDRGNFRIPRNQVFKGENPFNK
jgi:predicted site-specific integrase-resolvase